jgi:hypothetical protein
VEHNIFFLRTRAQQSSTAQAQFHEVIPWDFSQQQRKNKRLYFVKKKKKKLAG